MNNLFQYIKIRMNYYKITELKEKIIIQYILDIDSKGFQPKLKNIKDIVNHILELRNTKHIKKLWIYRFVKNRIELKMYFNYIYNFQKAFYKNFKLFEK